VNRAIVRLYLLVIVLFAMLIAWTSRWTVFEAEALRDNALNRRELLEEQRVNRGPIRASDGSVIARSVRGRAGTFSRRYPTRGLFSHPVGYSFIGIGRTGLEQSRNDVLSGRSDGITSVFDQLAGRPREGDEVRTSLNPAAQRLAYQALGAQKGAVVALEPQTGRVLVMASNPPFDPNKLRSANRFIGPEGSAVNRTTQGQYPPGSTFKVVTATAAIDSGRYTKDSVVDGKSPKVISGAPLNNFGNKDWGSIPLTAALTNSVNTVWAEVATELGGETMERYMERFGFYDEVRVDLPPEQRATSAVYVDRDGRRVQLPVTSDAVDVGRVAIGQGGLLTTPLQMAMVASAVANDGRLMVPTIADRIVDRDGRTVDRIEPKELSQVMKPQTAREVGDMMASVVREGTGTAAALSGLAVAGKTGTAEIIPEQNINQPWFIGFAPRDNPRIAIAVTIERSTGQGGVVAAPIAKQVMQELLK
jgi:peptidoglycan glycosyltransferase